MATHAAPAPLIQIIAHTPDRTTALVQGSKSEPYRVTLGPGWGACSCDDALYRAHSCKHVALAREARREAEATYTVNGDRAAAVVIRQAKEGWTCVSEQEGPDAWRLAAALADKLNAARPKLPQAKRASKAA